MYVMLMLRRLVRFARLYKCWLLRSARLSVDLALQNTNVPVDALVMLWMTYWQSDGVTGYD